MEKLKFLKGAKSLTKNQQREIKGGYIMPDCPPDYVYCPTIYGGTQCCKIV